MLSAVEQTAWRPGLERLANRLVSGYTARCAARARARAERAAADRKEYIPDGIFAVVPDGMLAVARQDSTYFLWLEWDDAYGQRLLAQGELAEVERTHREIGALMARVGATGSILIGTLLDELERRDLKRGLVTMCAAGGMAPAIIIERV